jgi:serine/threonine protein kinase
MRLRLTVTGGPHRGRAFELREHDTLIVGRSEAAQLRLPLKDKTLSRVHFMIEINPPSCRLMDMASTNGTFVNGRRVTTVDLADGDVIRLGRTELSLVFVDDEPDPDELQGHDGDTDTGTGTADDRDGPQPLARYRIEKELGRGGMGIVYLAHDDARGEVVALKVIIPAAVDCSDAIARFLREASLLRQLEHPHIVGFRAIGFAGDTLYFAMEYVPGDDASRLLRERGGRLPIELAVDLTGQLLGALSYAHALGVVHRDVKPSNLLVTTADGRPVLKVADFGFARLYLDSPLSGLTLAGQTGGTSGFLAPEQITNFREARPATDQYAAGATLYYLLTGRKPYDFPASVPEQLLMILQQDPVPIRNRRADVPEGLAAIVHRALARDPADRFPDIEAFRAALVAERGDAP